MHNFSDRLNLAIQNKKTPALVGLDPRFDWLPEEMDELDKRPGDAFFITEEHKRELLDIASWWKGKVLWDRGRANMTQELRDLQDSAIIKATGNLTSGDGHIAVAGTGCPCPREGGA